MPLKIRNAVELCRFVKDNYLNPQPVPVEEDIIDENSDPYQYRSKRMSKSPSSAEKPKSARISCAEQASQVPVEKQADLELKGPLHFKELTLTK